MDVINPHRFSTAAPPTVDFDGFGNASRYFDGVSDYIDLGDSDDFSFGDGVNDSPFSVSAWIKMDDHLKFRIIAKYKDQAPDEKEWVFSSDSTGRLMLFLSDNSTSATLNRRYSDTTTFASYVGQWIHVVGTYDGSGTDSGIKLYINGSRVDDVSLSSGSYTAMENTGETCKIGTLTTTAGQDYTQGYIADCRLYNSELSSTDIAALYGGENITTNLVGHWLKDTPSLLDHSGTNDGTNVGSAFAYDNPSPAVEFGKASRVFDGVNDYIDLGDSNDFSFGDGAGNDSPFSISAWVKLDTTTNTRAIIGKYAAPNGEWLLWYNGSNNEFRFSVYSQSGMAWIRAKSSLTINANQWYHVVGAYDGSKSSSGMKIYVDGSLDTTNDAGGGYSYMTNTTTPVIIGQYSSTAFFEGNIADVRLYNSELSSTDIAAIYGGENITTNLVGHWLTNTDDVNDYAGSNDGTNNGSTYSFDNPLGDGEFGSASRVFDRSLVQYVSVADSATFPTGAQTHACWFKPDVTASGGQSIIGKWGNGGNLSFLLYYIFSDLRVYVSGDGSSNVDTGAYSLSPATGAWHHAAFVFVPSTSLTLYINGSQVRQVTSGVPASLYDSTAAFRIGKMDRSYTAPFGGHICDVRMYDTALTGTDIFDISRGYDYRTNLIGQWLTNKDDVDDYAGTNHGTNNGSTYSQDAPL